MYSNWRKEELLFNSALLSCARSLCNMVVSLYCGMNFDVKIMRALVFEVKVGEKLSPRPGPQEHIAIRGSSIPVC